MTDEDKSKEQPEQPQDVKASDTEPSKTTQETTLTQTQVNKLLADERRKHEAKLKDLQTEYNGYKQTIEQREQAANDAAAEKVETLRKDIPESVIKLLDKLTPIEQLEWLSDPENAITKKEIPALPQPNEGRGGQRKSINIL